MQAECEHCGLDLGGRPGLGNPQHWSEGCSQDQWIKFYGTSAFSLQGT